MSRSPQLGIRLFGPLEVHASGRPIVVDTRKALAIVALVAAEGRPFARDELAAMLWPDADDPSARGALRRTLSVLRSAVGGAGLIIERDRVALDPDAASVDLVDFERLAAGDSMADLESAASLARGPFLAGFSLRDSPAFDDWQASRTVAVERAVGGVLDRLIECKAAAGETAGAIAAAERRVTLDPLDEPAQRRLIDLLARSGDRASAIRRYRALVATFDHELGVAPLRETTELYEAIRDGTSSLEAVRLADAHAARLVTADEMWTGPPANSPLIGRERELDVLVAMWSSVERDGRLAIIEGEAGIGKTRLGEAVAEQVRTAGGVALIGRAYPDEAGIAYAPIAGLLRSAPGRPDADGPLASLDQATRRELARIMLIPGAGRPTGGRLQLLDAIAAAVTTLATSTRPGLVWLDDLHLADDPTREAVAFLARRLAGRRILLLLSWRREDLSVDGVRTADDLARTPGARTITLGRLDPPVGGETAGGALASLQARIGSVDETAAQVLAAAAVLGDRFDIGTLRQVSGRTDEETVDAIEGLVRRGILREGSDREGRAGLEFAHGRFRETAYGAISLARRRLLHGRAADVMAARLSGPRDGDDDVARLAAHLRSAGRAVDAAAAFRRAADRAELAFANREAIRLLDASLALDEADGPTIRARIGDLRARVGDYPGAIAALEAAAASAGAAMLPDLELRLARVQRRRGDLGAASSHLDAALALADPGSVTAGHAWVERSLVALRRDDLDGAAAAAASALTAAEAVADAHVSGVAERIIGLVASARGDATTAAAALDRSLSLAADDPDPTAWVAATTARAIELARRGQVGEAVAEATRAIARCREIGDRHLEAAVENHLADVLHEAGRDADSMLHLKRAVALFAEVGEVGPEPDPGIWSLAAW